MINPLNLLTWKIKAVVAGALLLSGAWYIKHRETVAFENGVVAGHESGWADAEKQKAEEWADERARIDQERSAVELAASQLTSQRAALEGTRASITRQLNATLGQIATQNTEGRNRVNTLSSPDVVSAIRDALTGLRSIDQQRRLTNPDTGGAPSQ